MQSQEYTVTPNAMGIRFFLNAFPKAGIHLLGQMVAPVAQPMETENGTWYNHWSAMFKGNGWTNERGNLNQLLFKVSRLQDGHFIMSHCGFDQDVERFLWYSGISTLFLYRDPRDVAVSQVHHILSKDKRLNHPDKDRYWVLGDFDEVLEAVIVGLDEFPGVMDRWQQYAGWLDVDWVLKVRFEDLRQHPRREAKRILRYSLGRTAVMFNTTVEPEPGTLDEAAQMMVDFATNNAHKSPTFRKGNVGDWREAFTERHRQLFLEMDADGWLERLGYEW